MKTLNLTLEGMSAVEGAALDGDIWLYVSAFQIAALF